MVIVGAVISVWASSAASSRRGGESLPGQRVSLVDGTGLKRFLSRFPGKDAVYLIAKNGRHGLVHVNY